MRIELSGGRIVSVLDVESSGSRWASIIIESDWPSVSAEISKITPDDLRAIAAECDLLIGDEYSFAACLGMDLSDLGRRHTPMDVGPAEAAAVRAMTQFPALQAVAFTLRDAANAAFYVDRTGRNIPMAGEPNPDPAV